MLKLACWKLVKILFRKRCGSSQLSRTLEEDRRRQARVCCPVEMILVSSRLTCETGTHWGIKTQAPFRNPCFHALWELINPPWCHFQMTLKMPEHVLDVGSVPLCPASNLRSLLETKCKHSDRKLHPSVSSFPPCKDFFCFVCVFLLVDRRWNL